ncbi:MAG: helix-turn-helix domain-containing protein [Microbacteriaceae bacterium]
MTKTIRVPINGATLAWARNELGLNLSELAHAAGVKEEQAARFETADASPTLVQLRRIAKKLDRPVAFFFTSVPSSGDVPTTADFRGAAGNPMPAKLLTEMKRAAAHRDTFLDLMGAPRRPLVLRTVQSENVEKRAAELREELGLALDGRPSESQPGHVFNYWRGLLEERGILVFQTTGIPLTIFRGVSVHHEVMPVIIVNGADSANGKVFTLFHELGHLSNRTSGLCMLDDRVDVEAVCNSFAANALLPRGAVKRFLDSTADSPANSIDLLAAHFRVSGLAAAVRLRTLGLISEDTLERRKQESEEAWVAARARVADGAGFVPQWTMRYRDLGPAYVGAILTALQDDRLNYVDASYLLNARVPVIERMQREFRRRGATW